MWTPEQVEDGLVGMKTVQGEEGLADLLTKNLAPSNVGKLPDETEFTELSTSPKGKQIYYRSPGAIWTSIYSSGIAG